LVAKAAVTGTRRLDLSMLSTLEELPIGLSTLTDLEELRLGWLSLGTKVSDIARVGHLRSLRSLYLTNTPVTDLSPLWKLKNLQCIDFSNTPVVDISPLAALSFDRISPHHAYGIRFTNSGATLQSSRLAALAAIPDNIQRTRDVLAYLRENGTERQEPRVAEPTSQPEADALPSSRLAPLQVEVTDGKLEVEAGRTLLADDMARRAQAGHQALRELLEDLEPQLPRIHNSMPKLGAALERFAAAIGPEFEKVRAISAGMHAQRIQRLAEAADELLMEEDAADLAALAENIMQFMDRFPEWRAYREEAAESAPEINALAKQLREISDLTRAMAEHPEIAVNVTDDLAEQTSEVEEEPGDTVAGYGLLASIHNVLRELASLANPVWNWIRQEGQEIGKLTQSGVRKVIAGGITGGLTGLGGAAADILFNKAATLRMLANEFPTYLGWIAKVLSSIGL